MVPIFSSGVQKLDKMAIEKKERKICLIMDNCRTHPDAKALKAIDSISLTPNTTSVTKLIDQGIIQNFKVQYRYLLVKCSLLPAMEKMMPFQ